MKNTNAARNTLTKKLESIRTKREALRKQFEAKLEKVWAEHRAKMAELRKARKAAYEAYENSVAEPKVKKTSTKSKKVQSEKIEAVEPIVEQPVEVAEAVEQTLAAE